MLNKLSHNFLQYSASNGGSLSSQPILSLHIDWSSSFIFMIKGAKRPNGSNMVLTALGSPRISGGESMILLEKKKFSTVIFQCIPMFSAYFHHLCWMLLLTDLYSEQASNLLLFSYYFKILTSWIHQFTIILLTVLCLILIVLQFQQISENHWCRKIYWHIQRLLHQICCHDPMFFFWLHNLNLNVNFSPKDVH